MAAADVAAQRQPAGKPRTAYSALQPHTGTPSSPRTPHLTRSLSSQFGSPNVSRIEDEDVIYDIGSRYFRVGFAGEAAPKFICQYGADFSRRAGDYSHSPPSSDCVTDWELWDYHLVDLDIDLARDKLDRAVRRAIGTQLMFDLKTRGAIIALPPALPNALVEVVLRSIFTASNHPRSVCLTSSPVLCAISAGVRSALVVDIGWHETSVTVIYEYREVSQARSTRAGRRLAFETERMLSRQLPSIQQRMPFSTVDHIMTSSLWCQPDTHTTDASAESSATIAVKLDQGQTLDIKHLDLARPIEHLISPTAEQPNMFDHHDRTIPLMMWQALSALSPDVRGVCMSRICFSGGCSNIPGFKARLLRETSLLVEAHGWDQVRGTNGTARPTTASHQQDKADDLGIKLTGLAIQPEAEHKDARRTILEELRKVAARQGGLLRALQALEEDHLATMMQILQMSGSSRAEVRQAISDEQPILLLQDTLVVGVPQREREAAQTKADDITIKLEREALRSRPPAVKPELRAVRTLGAWAGASMMSYLRIQAGVEIKADDFLRHGMSNFGYPIR